MDHLVQGRLIVERTPVMRPSAGDNFLAYLDALGKIPEGHARIDIGTSEALARNSDGPPPHRRPGNACTPRQIRKRRQRLKAEGISSVNDQGKFRPECVRPEPSSEQGVTPDRYKRRIILHQMIMNVGILVFGQRGAINERVKFSVWHFGKCAKCGRQVFGSAPENRRGYHLF